MRTRLPLLQESGCESVNINKKLKMLREKGGMTQQDAAELFGTSLSTYQKYERDKNPNQPSTEMLMQIAKYYNVSLDWLLDMPGAERGDIMLKDTLKLLREQKNLTKKQVADAIEVTERAYITYEYGQRDVSTGTLQKLADFYGVTTDYLLGRQEATDSKKPLDEFAQRECLKNPEKIFLQKYLELTDDQRDNVLDFFRRVAECLHEET